MSDEREPEPEPTIRDVLAAVNSLRKRQREWVYELTKEVERQGALLEEMDCALTDHVSETRRELRELPALIVVGVMAGIEQGALVRDLQAQVAELKEQIIELKLAGNTLKRAAG